MLAGMIGAGVMVAVIVFFSYYKVDTVEVRGTSHYTDEEVKNMVLRGPMASNSVLASSRPARCNKAPRSPR